MDYDDTGFPKVIRDAMVIYSVNEHFSIGLGQTKLPGNRQRVNSSDDVLENTGRVELLPLGKFTNGGDYFEGDLVREPKPRLSVGATVSTNKKAIRTGGQLGKFLYEARDMDTYMLDILYKHRGFAFATEFIKRKSQNPITENTAGDKRYIYTGWGENFQGSYLWKNNYEVVGRYTRVLPSNQIRSLERSVEQYTVGMNRYIRGHRLKLQGDVTFEKNYWLGNTVGTDLNRWQVRFQIEAGI